jgi:uncharacterized protein (DUF58 family)
MLGFMAVSGMFGLRNLQKLDVSVKFPDEVYCGIPVQLTVCLSARSCFLPHYLLTVHFEGAEAAVPILGKGEKREQKALVTFKARGPGAITRAAVTSPFPVNFFVRSNILTLHAPYLVFPQPKPLPRSWSSGDATETGSVSQTRKGSSGETESIDQYTGSEPFKQIHWKLSARHDDLLVKEMSEEVGKPVIIDPDQLPGGMEERVGHAAFLINSFMAGGRAVGLRIGEKSIQPGISRGHRLKLLGELACHAPD